MKARSKLCGAGVNLANVAKFTNTTRRRGGSAVLAL